MDINKLIISLDEDIKYSEKNLSDLKDKREKFSNLQTLFPSAQYENGVFCMPDIWSRISCLRIEKKYHYRPVYGRNIVAKFSVGQKTLMNGVKMHTAPLNNVIATSNYRTREIIVNDYNSIIGIECPKRSQFIRRIRIYLVNLILREKLILDTNSYDIDSLNKLLMLA
jgi:hypothetical protein